MATRRRATAKENTEVTTEETPEVTTEERSGAVSTGEPKLKENQTRLGSGLILETA